MYFHPAICVHEHVNNNSEFFSFFLLTPCSETCIGIVEEFIIVPPKHSVGAIKIENEQRVLIGAVVMAVAVLSLLTVALLLVQNGGVEGDPKRPLLPPDVKLTDAHLFGSHDDLESAFLRASLLESGTLGDPAEASAAAQRLEGSQHPPRRRTEGLEGQDHAPGEVGDSRRVWGPWWAFHPVNEVSIAEKQCHPSFDCLSHSRVYSIPRPPPPPLHRRCVCVRACACVCVCACVRACVRERACVCV